MSTVGRIFIVLNLVLTFVLVGYVGALNYSGAKYRAAYERLQQNGEEQLSRWNQEIAGKTGQVKDLQAENASLRAQVELQNSRWNDLYNAYMAEKGASTAVAENYNSLAQKFEGWDGIYTDLSNKLNEYNTKIDELKRMQIQAAESERIARNREVTAAAFRVRADVEKQALIEQISMMDSTMEDKDATLAVYTALYGPLTPAPIGLVGRVVSVSVPRRLHRVTGSSRWCSPRELAAAHARGSPRVRPRGASLPRA